MPTKARNQPDGGISASESAPPQRGVPTLAAELRKRRGRRRRRVARVGGRTDGDLRARYRWDVKSVRVS